MCVCIYISLKICIYKILATRWEAGVTVKDLTLSRGLSIPICEMGIPVTTFPQIWVCE